MDLIARLRGMLERFVDALTSAFEDPVIDKNEQRLDSTTLFRCSQAMELIARLRGMQGNSAAEAEAREKASDLLSAADRDPPSDA